MKADKVQALLRQLETELLNNQNLNTKLANALSDFLIQVEFGKNHTASHFTPYGIKSNKGLLHSIVKLLQEETK